MEAVATERARASDYFELAKPRIVVFIVLSASVGFLAAGGAALPSFVFVNLLIGTALAAACANGLNQVIERERDALMPRTADRPVASGRVTPVAASFMSVVAGGVAITYLAALVNVPTALLALATILSYVAIYTPLKTVTSLSTLVGAIPGALPVVGGWVAADGGLGLEVWVLFWIMFLWQLPHFLAIAWMYRSDYARGGFRMLSIDDRGGRATFRQATLYAVCLIPVSIIPALLGMANVTYLAGALVLGIAYAWASLRGLTGSDVDRAARRLFLASLVYLPAVFTLLVLGRI